MKLYSTTEAAHFLSVCTSYLEQLRCRGGGPVYRKLGRLVRYTRSDLDAWVDSFGTRKHTSQQAPDPVPVKKSPLPRLRLTDDAA